MELKLNRKYKDTLFRKVFNNKKDLLSLYNALNDTSHTDDSLITINTIEDAIYIGYKNDIIRRRWQICYWQNLMRRRIKKQSYADGETNGEEKMAELVVKLKESGRTDELIKITDKKERERLYKEFNM